MNRPRPSWPVAVLVLFALIATIILVFTIIRFGWLRDWFPGIPHIIIMLVNPATLTGLFYVIWARWVKIKTRSLRMSAIAMFTCIMVGFVIYTAIGIWFRGPNWEFFWSVSQWPTV